MKTISIILTCYNSENSIERVLKSFFNQKGINTEFKLEVIVIDDCSTDNTIMIAKKYPIKFFVTDKNSGGPNKGRNIGLNNASGDFICIADHDDEWKENKVISLLPYLDKVAIVTSGQTIINTSSNKTINRVANSKNEFIYYKKNETFLSRLSKSSTGQNTYLGSIMFHQQLKHILFEENFGVVDFDWGLKLFLNNASIEVCKSLYNRYVSANNLSLNKLYRKKDFYYSLYTLEDYEEKYPKHVKEAYKKILGARARYYYFIGDMKKARNYFLKSKLTAKNVAYYLTTFVGYNYVRKKFNVFG